MNTIQKIKLIENYFHRYKTIPPQITEAIPNNLKLSVIIPIHNEPNLWQVIECLSKQKIDFHTEIILVFNDAKNSPSEAKKLNETQFLKYKNYKKLTSNIDLHSIYLKDLSPKIAGVGFARKVGFDEALRRFLQIKNPDAILVSLDADTKCDKNYLKEIFNFYKKNPDYVGANVCFYHPITEDNLGKAITLYELHLRYYNQALKWTGFPFAHHTIGSIFTVKAYAYASQGGIPIKQAGEDFYFLSKIFQFGKYGLINKTSVFPSNRITDRVPFGTGVAVKQIIENNFQFTTYQFVCFELLKNFLSQIDKLYNSDLNSITINPQLKKFLLTINFPNALAEINKNSASLTTFKKRFFHWFNNFKIVKLMNFLTSYFPKKDVLEQTNNLFENINLPYAQNPKQALLTLRNFECKL